MITEEVCKYYSSAQKELHTIKQSLDKLQDIAQDQCMLHALFEPPQFALLALIQLAKSGCNS